MAAELTKDDRNNVILLMVFRIKYMGSCHDISIDLIQNGISPKLVMMLENTAKNYHDTHPNFTPIPLF